MQLGVIGSTLAKMMAGGGVQVLGCDSERSWLTIWNGLQKPAGNGVYDRCYGEYLPCTKTREEKIYKERMQFHVVNGARWKEF